MDDGTVTPAAATKPVRAWRTRVIQVVRILAALAIAYFIVATTVQQWSSVSETFRSLSWPSLGASLVCAVACLWATMMAWRAMVGSLDHPLRIRDAAPIQLVGALGKYLPGTVWAYVVQMELGRRVGVSRAKVFIGSAVVTGLGVTVGLIMTAPGFGVAFDGAAATKHQTFAAIAVWCAVILLPFGLVCCYPPLLTWLVGRAMRVLRRPALDRPITWRPVLVSSAWSAVGFHGLIGSVFAMALAMSISAFVIVAPSGLGAREFLMAIALAGLGVPWPTAWALTLVSRLLFTLADVAAAGVSAAVGLRRIRHSSPPALTPEPEPDEA
jgi:hypothetical protein